MRSRRAGQSAITSALWDKDPVSASQTLTLTASLLKQGADFIEAGCGDERMCLFRGAQHLRAGSALCHPRYDANMQWLRAA